VDTKIWIYYDSQEEFGYDHESPPVAWHISDEAFLYAPEEAARLKLRIKGKWQPPGPGPVEDTCAVCGNPVSQCTCFVSSPTVQKLEGQGAVSQAFQQVLDLCQEQKVERLKRVSIKIEAAHKQAAADLRSLGLAIPQFGKGRFTVTQDLIASYGQEAGTPGAVAFNESFRTHFEGGWDRYKRLKQVVEPFAQEAGELKVTMRVTGEFDDGLDVSGDQLATIREVLVQLGVGKVLVEATPA
jgi:hypothetical protein